MAYRMCVNLFLNMRAQLSSKTRALIVSLSLSLYLSFVNAWRDCICAQAFLNLRSSPMP